MFRSVARSRAGEAEGCHGGAGGLKRRRQRPVRDVNVKDDRDCARRRRCGAHMRRNVAAMSSSVSRRAEAAGPARGGSGRRPGAREEVRPAGPPRRPSGPPMVRHAEELSQGVAAAAPRGAEGSLGACTAAGHVARAAGPGGRRSRPAEAAGEGRGQIRGSRQQPRNSAPHRGHEQRGARAGLCDRRQSCRLARAAAVALGPQNGDYGATRRGVRQQDEMTARRGPPALGPILEARAPGARAVHRDREREKERERREEEGKRWAEGGRKGERQRGGGG